MKTLEDIFYLEDIQKDGFENELLKKQIAKFHEIDNLINKQFETHPTVGHGGTPHILDNSKGRRMKKVCDRHDDRTRKLFEQRDLQIDKIQKTCNSINYRKYERNKQTKKSKKFISKNPISEILFKMEEDGIVKQWKRNPQFFFLVDFKKVALFTLDGKVCVNAKYKPDTKEDLEKIKFLIKKYEDKL